MAAQLEQFRSIARHQVIRPGGLGHGQEEVVIRIRRSGDLNGWLAQDRESPDLVDQSAGLAGPQPVAQERAAGDPVQLLEIVLPRGPLDAPPPPGLVEPLRRRPAYHQGREQNVRVQEDAHQAGLSRRRSHFPPDFPDGFLDQHLQLFRRQVLAAVLEPLDRSVQHTPPHRLLDEPGRVALLNPPSAEVAAQGEEAPAGRSFAAG